MRTIQAPHAWVMLEEDVMGAKLKLRDAYNPSAEIWTDLNVRQCRQLAAYLIAYADAGDAHDMTAQPQRQGRA